MPTFGQAAVRTFEAHRARWRAIKTAANWTASMATYAYPVFGDRHVDEIGREDVLCVLTPVWSSKHALAVKVRGRIRVTLGWAQAHGYVEHNVAGECIDGALPRLAVVKRLPGPRLPRGRGCSRRRRGRGCRRGRACGSWS